MRQHLPQFTIRDLLWVMMVAALVTCWYRERIASVTTMENQEAKLAVERAADKAKLERELALTNLIRGKSQEAGNNASQMLRVINDAHKKEMDRLNKKISQLEGPGYGDKVEPKEVAGLGIEWWADRANYFERKFRESEQNSAKRRNDRSTDEPTKNSN